MTPPIRIEATYYYKAFSIKIEKTHGVKAIARIIPANPNWIPCIVYIYRDTLEEILQEVFLQQTHFINMLTQGENT